MRCPKCGYNRQTRDNAFVPATECPACGVVYSKHETGTPDVPVRTAAPTPPNLRPSPVDQASLKKARERVEKRLRKRLESNVKDERHAQTLKLARRFTEEEIRKRRSQYEETQYAGSEGPDPISPTDAPSAEATDISPPMATSDKHTDGNDEARASEVVEAPAEEAPVEEAPMEGVAVSASETDEATSDTPGQIESSLLMQEVESDVRTETVILRSAQPIGSDGEAAQTFDSTPLKTMPPQEDTSQPERAPKAADPETASEEIIKVASLSALTGLSHRSSGLVSMLTAVAWLILGAGVIGAILSWTTIGDVEAGMRIPVPDSSSSLPIGLLLGFAYLATGALGFAFFWVSSIISRQLKDIRRLLMLQPGIMVATDGAPDFSDVTEDQGQPEA